MLLMATEASAQRTIVAGDTDGDGVLTIGDVTSLVNMVLGNMPRQEINIAGQEYVDLGLPSGTLWATCNIGASSPEQYGNFFAWGETVPYGTDGKTIFNWSTYKYCNGTEDSMTKYCTIDRYSISDVPDRITELEPVDDAATGNWGLEWRMPSYARFEELRNDQYTTWPPESLNNVNGIRVTSKTNNKSIFLPMTGYRLEGASSQAGEDGAYWSRTLNSDYPYSAMRLYFGSGDMGIRSALGPRYYGQAIRPVKQTVSLTPRVDNTTLAGQTWHRPGGVTVVFNADGTTTYLNATTYEYRPSTRMLTLYDGTGTAIKDLWVTEMNDEYMIVADPSEQTFTRYDANVIDRSGMIDGRMYVDLDLPSGTLWATCNVGASSPEEHGEYFAWEETSPKSNYNWDTYKYYQASFAENGYWTNMTTKYCNYSNQGSAYVDYPYNDDLLELEVSDDAAHKYWGANWCMPTEQQILELFYEGHTTLEETSVNGVSGIRFTSVHNGNSIFLPAVGRYIGSEFDAIGVDGYMNTKPVGNYWSHTRGSTSERGISMNFTSDGQFYPSNGHSRCNGYSIRPVRR